jgi:undecaprenyl-diphosphatase
VILPLTTVGASLNLFQVIVLALLQGIAELFPISSLGHTVILPALLHWQINQQAPAYLAFVVLLHFGTAAALLFFYWRDWLRLLRALWASLARGKLSDDPDERFIWLIIVGTVPAVVLALLFEQPLRENFGHPRTAALLLAANGLLMLAGEVLRRRQSATAHARLVGAGRSRVSQEDGAGEPVSVSQQDADGAPMQEYSASQEYKDVDQLGWRGALIVGLFQSLALFPGISRSGATMVGGLVLGLRHHEAMRYAFMLATPIIIAASLKTTPDLLAPAGRSTLGYAVLGCIISAVAAYLSVRFLDRYFQTKRLDPFAYYCLVAGIGALALLPTK